MAEFPDTLAPNFSLTVENNRLDGSVRECITSVEYESVDGMADLLRINISDQLNANGRMPIRDSKIFMPGNEVSVWMGYGTQLRHVGRAIIRKVRAIYPGGGVPGLEVIGYTADSQMADTGPEALKETKHLKKGGTRIKNSKAGRVWKNARYSDAVKDRGAAYGFELDVDTTPHPPEDFIQKANMKDFAFIQGIANFTGFIFWVDGAPDGTWTLHFKDPSKIRQADLQEREYTFKYGDGDFSTLLSFEPELALTQAITKLTVQTKDPITGRVLSAKIEEEADDNPDTKIDPGNVTGGFDARGAGLSKVAQAEKTDVQGKGLMAADHQLEGPLSTACDLKIYIEEFAFDIKANRRFRNEAELANWAAQWFRRNRENFMLSRGTLVGLETLSARQIHTCSGLGTAFDGKYYFSRVRHVVSQTGGYQVDFNARRTVSELPPVTSKAELDVTQLLIDKGNLS